MKQSLFLKIAEPQLKIQLKAFNRNKTALEWNLIQP
jgi:hypothetical protein